MENCMKGSCLCGAVVYQVRRFYPEIANCHCGMCRKFHGAAFATYGKVQVEDLQWLAGKELLKVFVSSGIAERGFCSECGSSLYYKRAGQDQQCSLALGSLDGEPDRAVDNSIFCDSRPQWSRDNKGIPAHDLWPQK
jgi:hypothetical protein